MVETELNIRTMLEPTKHSSLDEVSALSNILQRLTPQQRIRHVLANSPGEVVITTSAGRNAPILISMLAELANDPDANISRAAKDVPIIFIDAQNHPRETLFFLNALKAKFSSLNFRRFTVDLKPEDIKTELIRTIYRQPTGDTPIEEFLKLVKVRPLASVFKKIREEGRSVNYWLAGNRRDQSQSRAGLGFAESQSVGVQQIVKVFPLADFSKEQAGLYKTTQGLPEYPLPKEEYPSIGLLLEMKKVPPNSVTNEKGNRVVAECGLHHNHSILTEIPVREIHDWSEYLSLPDDLTELIRAAIDSRPRVDFSI